MTRQHVIAVGLAALAWPVLAQEGSYQYQDEQGSTWSDEAPPQEAPPSAAPGSDVDVSVDFATPGASVTFDTFQEGLAPYGEWVTVPSYGRVWRPARVAAGWRPYYYGKWEWTDEGWLWVSDEPFGWAAYHYGRWTYDGSYGWVWIPGYQWAPAWVTWRYSPDYVGWAPLGPGFSVYVTSYPAVYGWWTFVPCQRFVGVPVWSAAYGGGHVRGLFHATLPAPPRAHMYGAAAPAWGGPARPYLEHRIGHAIAPVRVQAVASPAAIGGAARPGVVPIYRPEVRPGRPATALGASAPRPATAGVAPGRPGPSASVAPGRPGPSASAVPARPRSTAGVAPVRPWGGGAGGRPWAPPASPPSAAPRPSTGNYRPAPAQGGGYRPAPAPAQGGGSYRAVPGQGGGNYRPAPAQGGGAPRAAPAPRPAPARPQGYAPQSYAPRAQAAPRVQAYAGGSRGGGSGAVRAGGGGHGGGGHRR